MSAIPSHFHIKADPVANPESVVVASSVRFTVLTSRLIRMEYSKTDDFEDKASQVFLFRRQPAPTFQIRRSNEGVEIETDHLTLSYRINPQGFNDESLTVRLITQDTLWCYGDTDSENLLGTVRSLDNVEGATALELGLISRSGWAVVDDSYSPVFAENSWPEARSRSPDDRDLYFFGYGNAFGACLADYYRIAGRMPLPPRWALGNWWSRYWPYTQEELMNLMVDFQAFEIPLSVCVADMDWHLVDVGEGINGWTGYTWNKDLFPDPVTFFQMLHGMGLKSALNLHPALGVRPHEEGYAVFAERIGLNPEDEADIPFDIANASFADAYFEELHHPLEEQGVDFWWVDWQQGEESTTEGLDPLWMLNHLHYSDKGRDGKERALILSRWGGLGSHRYPVGFSGDAIVSWDSLAFQPYFTATAANVGYSWWSHDIGGHMLGIEDPELYTRWIQFGVFSPILRIHSTNSPFSERRPWGYGAEVLRIARDAMQLRHALIPYIYTMAWRNADLGQPIIRPMYHDYPENEAAFVCPQQYAFGDGLVVAPFVSPADADTRLCRQVVWLPPGDWYGFFTGEYFPGDAWYSVYGQLDDIPVFARAGAIVPLAPKEGWGGTENPGELDLHLFASADGDFTLYEDDGETTGYRRGEYCLTNYSLKFQEDSVVFKISPVTGKPAQSPSERRCRLHFHGVKRPDHIDIKAGENDPPFDWAYDELREMLLIYDLVVMPGDGLEVLLKSEGTSLLSRRDRTVEICGDMLHAYRLESITKVAIDQDLPEIVKNPEVLLSYSVNLTDSHLRAFLETICRAGIHRLNLYNGAESYVIWNNSNNGRIRYQYSTERDGVWDLSKRFGSESGGVHRYQVIVPESRWQLNYEYNHLLSLSFSGSLTKPVD